MDGETRLLVQLHDKMRKADSLMELERIGHLVVKPELEGISKEGQEWLRDIYASCKWFLENSLEYPEGDNADIQVPETRK